MTDSTPATAACRCGHERADHSPAREDDFGCRKCACNGFDPATTAATVRCVRSDPHDPHEWWTGHETRPLRCPGVVATAARRTGACPLGCGYNYPIPACVRFHLIQHHDCTYAEAQEMYPDE